MTRLLSIAAATLFLASPALAGHAIFDAVEDGDRPRVTKIVRADPDAIYLTNTGGHTALTVAVANGDEPMVTLLAKAGAAVDYRGCSVNGQRVDGLTFVSHTGDERMVTTLLRLGAKPDAGARPGDSADTTPLHAACLAGHPRIVLRLLKANARVNVRDWTGATPLMLAVSSKASAKQSDAIALLEPLLEAKASVNQADTDGRTPLMEAAAKGHTAVVQKLLEAGADPSLRDHGGQTAVARAIASEHYGVAKVLEAWESGDRAAAKAAAGEGDAVAPTTVPAPVD